MFNEQLALLQRELNSLNTQENRYETGANAYILPKGANQVIKISRDQTSLKDEFEKMVELWERGFSAMPQPVQMMDSNRFAMTAIHNVVQLREVCQAYHQGKIPKMVIRHILDIFKEVLEQMWSLGCAHLDLHFGNILVGQDEDCNWQIFIIDFGTAEIMNEDGRSLPYPSTAFYKNENNLSLDEVKVLFQLEEEGVKDLFPNF